MPLPNDYVPRKGDALLIRAMVEDESPSIYGDGAPALFVRVDGHYNAQRIDLNKFVEVDRYSLKPGDKVLVAPPDPDDDGKPVAAVVVAAPEGADEVWVKFDCDYSELVERHRINPVRTHPPGPGPRDEAPGEPAPPRLVPRVVAESPSIGESLDSAGPLA